MGVETEKILKDHEFRVVKKVTKERTEYQILCKCGEQMIRRMGTLIYRCPKCESQVGCYKVATKLNNGNFQEVTS